MNAVYLHSFSSFPNQYVHNLSLLNKTISWIPNTEEFNTICVDEPGRYWVQASNL